MEGTARRGDTVYRCNARTLVPGSATAMRHPQQIYLREDVIVPRINRWSGSLFDPVHREATITALLEADDSADRALEHVNTLRSRVAARGRYGEVAESTQRGMGSNGVARAVQRSCRGEAVC
jgi:hypothetical protein